MIVRDEGSSLLLITQPDHGRLAHDIVAAMRTETVLHGPGRDTILLATREHDNEGYRAELRGSTLVIAPDPFEGRTVPLRVMARRIPSRRYVNDADLNAALAESVPEFLIGDARGA